MGKSAKVRIAQHLFEKEIRLLHVKGEALQGDYNRLRSTVAALTRKQGTVHLTREDLEGTVRAMEDGSKMLVTQHPEGDGLILSFGKEENASAAVVKAGGLRWWSFLLRIRFWFARLRMS
jgi:hypothetical protein